MEVNMKTKFITRTAIILALTILFQSMGRFVPLGQLNQFITGSLVNACLLLAAAFTGIWGGAAVSLLSPFGAILTGASIPLPFAPFIAVGNFILVLMFVIFKKKYIIGMASGAVLKFGFLWAAINLFVNLMGGKPALQPLLIAFSWPQLVTASIGGLIAFLVIKALGKVFEKESAQL